MVGAASAGLLSSWLTIIRTTMTNMVLVIHPLNEALLANQMYISLILSFLCLGHLEGWPALEEREIKDATLWL